jgi:hypothetical protein
MDRVYAIPHSRFSSALSPIATRVGQFRWQQSQSAESLTVRCIGIPAAMSFAQTAQCSTSREARSEARISSSGRAWPVFGNLIGSGGGLTTKIARVRHRRFARNQKIASSTLYHFRTSRFIRSPKLIASIKITRQRFFNPKYFANTHVEAGLTWLEGPQVLVTAQVTNDCRAHDVVPVQSPPCPAGAQSAPKSGRC